VKLYERHREVSAATHPYLVTTESAIMNGQAVVRAIAELQTSLEFQPRLVFSHAGNGLGLFIRDLCPDALHVSYTEWYFKPDLAHYLLGRNDLNTRLRAKCRNLVILQELEGCDLAVTPTFWQRSQFPKELQGKIQVVFDGVDMNYFHPPTELPGALELSCDSGETVRLDADDLVLSYATRGMEPLRGFPELMRSLPVLLQRFPQLKVVIAGQDRRAYSYDAHSHNGSWKNHIMEQLENFAGLDRIFFTGLLNYGQYRSLLHRSDVHVYFTRPYVLSWGYLQAAACGCRLLVNQSPAIEDIKLKKPALTVDLDDRLSIVNGAIEMLNTAPAERGSKRKTLLEPQMDLKRCLDTWQNLINKALQSSKQKE